MSGEKGELCHHGETRCFSLKPEGTPPEVKTVDLPDISILPLR